MLPPPLSTLRRSRRPLHSLPSVPDPVCLAATRWKGGILAYPEGRGREKASRPSGEAPPKMPKKEPDDSPPQARNDEK